MNNLVSPALSKVTAAILLLISLMLVIALFVNPLHHSFSKQLQRIASLENSVSRYQTIINNQEGYKRNLQQITDNPLPNIFYSATNNISLQTMVQNDIRQLLVSSGVNIDSMQSIQPTKEGLLLQAGVSLTIRADITTLESLLRSLSQSNKIFSIDNLVIRAPEIQSDRTSPILTIRCDIFSYGTIQ